MKAITFYRRKTFPEALQTNIIQLQALRRLLGAMKVSSNPLPLSHPIDKRKFDFSDPFLCHFASAEVPCKKVKFKVEKVSGKFVHICTHLVSSCLKDIKSFSFDGHWPGLQKVTRILSCCPECGLKVLLLLSLKGLITKDLTVLQQVDINCSSLQSRVGRNGEFERKFERK